MAETVLVAGALAQRPGYGGHAWVFLQYLLGFRRLGWDVLFLDRLEPDMCVDEAGRPVAIDQSWNLAYLREQLEAYGLGGAYSVICDGGRRHVGLSRAQVVERADKAALILNVMGYLDDPEILGRPARRVFVDIDPGFGQMWHALGLADIFAGHDDFVTIGENIGAPGCVIPTCGRTWITTAQPVVLSEWPIGDGTDGGFTTVASWRGPNGPIEYDGVSYGLRVHEFRKFLPVPAHTGQTFRIALDIDRGETEDLNRLSSHGWSVVDPRVAAGSARRYQTFVGRSMAEFGVAKQIYVQSRSGWLSDRTLCYLASGRPAVVQDTGLADRYPTGEGLLTFATLEEATAAIDGVAREPRRHARAARAIAEEHFDSDKVLGRLLTNLGVH
jgi:hypothetical protein